jgi:hypothetical protein
MFSTLAGRACSNPGLGPESGHELPEPNELRSPRRTVRADGRYMMATEETRASLIAMAQAWHRLAEEQEASVPPNAVEQFQPVVQQQQQVPAQR